MLVCFREVHLNYILHKLNKAITSGSLTPERVF
jgi:EF-hand domain pair